VNGEADSEVPGFKQQQTEPRLAITDLLVCDKISLGVKTAPMDNVLLMLCVFASSGD
jgi:hypothetical protein